MFSPIRRPRSAALLGACVAALTADAAMAQIAPPFTALLGQAQARAPRLAEADALVRQAEGQAQQARARPNPTVSAEIENFGGGQPFKGLDLAESTFSVSQTLELGGKRNARVAAGKAGVDAAQARRVQTGADYAAELLNAYAGAEAADRRLALARSGVALAKEEVRVAQVLVDAGRESRLRLLQVQATVTSANAEAATADLNRVQAFAELSALAGSAETFSDLGESLLSVAPPNRRVDDAVSATPAVAAADAERQAAARRVNVERVRGVPDVTASFGVRRFEGDDATALVAGISAPLPLFDRNRGNIGAARAELQAAEARLAAAKLEAQAALRVAVSRSRAAEVRVQAALEEAAAATETYRLTRTGYESGKLPLIELLNARRTLADARARVIDAQLARVRAEADRARLEGRPPFGA